MIPNAFGGPGIPRTPKDCHVCLPVSVYSLISLKASEEEAFRLYELNLLAFVLKKFDFWGPKCPNYENIEF